MADKKLSNPLVPFQNRLTGRCIPGLDALKLEFVSEDQTSVVSDNFTSLKNIRYTDNGVTGVTHGMTKINATALPTYPKIRRMTHFRKVQPAESHVLVHARNSGETVAKVFQNTTAIPTAGNFEATALHTDASGAGLGRFSSAPDEHVVYCNGAETMVWGGDSTRISSFEVYDEFADSFSYNYTEVMQNTLSDADNIASFFRDGDAPIKVTLRVGNTLPIEGIKFIVETVNTNILDDAVTVYEWTGSAWSAVTSQVDGTITGTSPNEVTFGQSGSITFDSTESTAKASIINGIFGYFYKVEIVGAVAATRISNVTVIEPFQELKDFWDGELRTASSVQLFQDSIYKDNTVNVFEDSFIYNDITEGNIASYMKLNALATGTGYLALGFAERQQGLEVKMLPDFGNLDIAATGHVVIWDTDAGGLLTSLTVDGVSIISAQIPIDEVDSEPSFCAKVARNINAHTSTPNYGAHISEDDDVVIIITAKTRGTGPNGFVVASSDDFLSMDTSDMAGGIDTNPEITIKYWNGTAWITVGTVTDGTIGDGASFGKSGFITWNAIAENTEFKRELNEEQPLYYYQLSWDETFNEKVLCYHISGIPTQRDISNYKFSLHAQDRLWLFSDQSGRKNQSIVSNLGELNTFNGRGAGDPITYGDQTEPVAAIELFERTSTEAKSHVLVLKENSIHVVEGNNPENWTVVNLTDRIGCNAPYTVSGSTLGFEFAPLQRKQIAIWQGSSGIYMFDGTSVIPISDDISNFFDQKNANAINLAYSNISYGFFEVTNGEHFYHWLFASGSSTVLNEEWVFDIKRQKWFEFDRGAGKALQGGGTVIDANGNSYAYGFEDNGYLQRLNNGTDFDGNSIAYEMGFGDVLPAGDMNTLTSIDSVRLAVVSKSTTSSSISVFHYGDTKTAATQDTHNGNAYYTFGTLKTGQRVAFPFKRINTPAHMTHKLKFTISTNNETGTGFEPLLVGGFYKARGFSEQNLTD